MATGELVQEVAKRAVHMAVKGRICGSRQEGRAGRPYWLLVSS